MEWVETTGRTVDEAKDAALDQLGVDESDAEFVVVSEPKAGLFGRVRGEARVRARLRPTSPRPKRTRTRRPGEQRDARRSRSNANRGGSRAQSGGSTTASVALADNTEGAAEEESPGGALAGAGGNGTAPGTTSGARRRSRSRSRGSGSGRPAQGSRASADESGTQQGTNGPRQRGARSSDKTKEEAVGETMTLEEQGASARGFIAGLVDELGIQADVTTRVVDEETAEVAVDGEELGVLIGPGGATLQALQELARTYVQKATGGHSSRIVVDVAGYRAKRAAALQRFTRQVAEEALAAGSERSLEPMSASDRKVVHDTINEFEGLSTRSEGEEPRRHIVIYLDEAVPAGDAGD